MKTKLLSFILGFVVTAGLHAQLVITPTNTSTFSEFQIGLETGFSDIVSFEGTGDGLDLIYADTYTFESVTIPNDWTFTETATGNNQTKRTFYYEGTLVSDTYDYEQGFNLQFRLNVGDPFGQPPTTQITWVSRSRQVNQPGTPILIGGDFDAYVFNDGAMIPEPSTYALILGGSTLLGVLYFRRRKRTPED